MDFDIIMLGIIELAISLITGFLVFFLSFRLFMLFTKKLNEVEELNKNNIAVAIVMIAFIFGIMLIVNTAVAPSMDTLEQLLSTDTPDGLSIFLNITRIVLSYVIAGVIAFFILWLSFLFFTFLTTKIDEMAEIRNNNTAIALLLGTFILSASILILHPISTILDSFVAGPDVVGTVVSMKFVNLPILIQGLIELPIAFFGVLLVFIMGFKTISLITRSLDELTELKNNNIAVAVFCSSFIFSIMLLINACLDPSYKVLKNILSAENAGLDVIFLSILRIVLFFLFSAIFAFIIIRVAMLFLMLLTTKIREMEEIKKNNLAVALIVAILVISTAVVIQHGMTVLLSGFVQNPDLGSGMPNLLQIK
ncbi:MAG: DUF350 domain-containing protein [Spirochaetales bacterium]|nr:DUF350 domain-containing protein [Spirochaetales bacterium]